MGLIQDEIAQLAWQQRSQNLAFLGIKTCLYLCICVASSCSALRSKMWQDVRYGDRTFLAQGGVCLWVVGVAESYSGIRSRGQVESYRGISFDLY